MTEWNLSVDGKSLGQKIWNRQQKRTKSKRPKKQVVTSWEERTVEDPFNGVKNWERLGNVNVIAKPY